ncbi:GNAT family N-acetyltransferase [Pseudoalteromonas luteoviolacea]|uniref:GNAT family N-acetyltransferase n=1 Tax=Pseudoalteromonas luteoviolacea TaxID=43657 RepID=UPI001B399495|nr:GNAT family N-acetyltransferase [Pseudoalteromonas luteoviolacea]MBQ4814339.1 GNAT family N-acetyltransferase [Pseudoalteromonas luteoviolacea]
MKPLIQTARLDLYNCETLITSHDNAAIVTSMLTPNTAAFLPEDWQSPPDANLALDWLINKLSQSEIYVALKKGDLSESSRQIRSAPLGLFIVHIEQITAHIGYLIHEQYWHQGYGTELLIGCLTYLRTHSLVKTVYAGVDENNLGSVRTLKKCNFQAVGNDAEQQTAFYTLHL